MVSYECSLFRHNLCKVGTVGQATLMYKNIDLQYHLHVLLFCSVGNGKCTCHILLSFSLPLVLKICQWFLGMLFVSFIRGGLIHQNVTSAPSPNVLILVVKLVSVSQHCYCSSCKLILLPSYEQPQVSSASVNLETSSAVVLPMPEVMVTENWQQNLGEMLANHLTNCGFKSSLQGWHILIYINFLSIFYCQFSPNDDCFMLAICPFW